MIIRASLCRIIAVTLLVATSLSACTSWQVQTVTPEQVVTTQHPSAVRVQLLDGNQIVLDSPRIAGDSILGATGGKMTGVPLAGVHDVAVRHGSTGKTIGLVIGVTAGTLIGLAIIGTIIVCNETTC